MSDPQECVGAHRPGPPSSPGTDAGLLSTDVMDPAIPHRHVVGRPILERIRPPPFRDRWDMGGGVS